jgi:hypothetical protein
MLFGRKSLTVFKVYQSIKLVYGDQSTKQIRETVMKTDNVTASEEEYISRWLEHFTALLNQPAEISGNLHEYLPKQCIVRDDLAFTVEQVHSAFNCTENGNAPGQIGFPAESFD